MNDMAGIQAVATPETSFLLKFLIDNGLNLLFGIIGAAGTFYGIMSWKSGQNDKRIYRFIFELAEKNIDKNITEESLKQKKEEIQNATIKIENLQNQIRSDIPKEARKAILKDKLNSLQLELVNTHKNIGYIKEEMSGLGESNEIPPELLAEIEKEIRPEYLIKEERENLKTYLTILTTLAAITSAIFPWEISSTIGSIFLIAGLFVLLLLIQNIYSTTPRKKKIFITKCCQATSIGIAVSLIAIIIAVCTFAEFNQFNRIDMVFILIILGILAALALILYFVLKKYIDKYSESKITTPS